VTQMKLSIAQKTTMVNERWWKWGVWIEGNQEDLGSVESVTYILHPTFSKPVQIRKNKYDKFLLEEEGWGEFEIRARVKLQSSAPSVPLLLVSAAGHSRILLK